jgi:protein-S-isoprenylcysteine O-methyltransferase Ste14
MPTPTPLALATLSGVIICWMMFAGIFLFRKKPPTAPEARRDKRAKLGVVLQMVGYFLVFFQPPRRPFLPPVPALSGTVSIIFSVFTVGLAAGSVWLVASSVRVLGRQWAVSARLVEDHKLITMGPYAFVRNPIYTGMFGMLIATGFATEHWVALIAAVVIFGVGLVIRVRLEEKLLRAAFRDEFEDYARRVPAVLPGIY